jgi:anti-sigma factor RsiW
MNCTEGNVLMELYCSGELEARAMAEFEQHMQKCVACAREYKSITEFHSLLRTSFEEERLDAGELRYRVTERIRERSVVSSRGRAFPFWAAGIAAAILILATVAGVAFLRTRQKSETTYSAALEDHLDEVVLGKPRKWRESSAEIDAFLQTRLQNTRIREALPPPGYVLKRVKVCDLAGERFLHFVYSNNARSVSMFVKVEGPDSLPVQPNVLQIEEHSVGELQVAGFRSKSVSMFVVSDLPRDENARLARDAAGRIV